MNAFKTPTIRTITALLRRLKRTIADDYRCTDDPDDNTPGMLVAVGASPDGSWNYQTGDNSFSGGAYGHRFWGLVYLYRRTNCREAARQCVEDIADQMRDSV
jgi:hypothetical protein